MLAASLAAVIVLLAQPTPAPIAPSAPPPAVIRVATLTVESGAAAMTLVYDAGSGELYLAPTTEMASDTRVPHLWLVMPEGGVQLVGAVDGSIDRRLQQRVGHAVVVVVLGGKKRAEETNFECESSHAKNQARPRHLLLLSP
jgi:anti-sigma-K factor RskA